MAADPLLSLANTTSPSLYLHGQRWREKGKRIVGVVGKDYCGSLPSPVLIWGNGGSQDNYSERTLKRQERERRKKSKGEGGKKEERNGKKEGRNWYFIPTCEVL